MQMQKPMQKQDLLDIDYKHMYAKWGFWMQKLAITGIRQFQFAIVIQDGGEPVVAYWNKSEAIACCRCLQRVLPEFAGCERDVFFEHARDCLE